MEKRLVSFLIAMALVMTSWMMLQNAVLGPPDQRQVAQEEGAELEDAEVGVAEPEQPALPNSADAAETQTDEVASDEEQRAEQRPATEAAETEAPPAPTQILTLGSLDPASGYKTLVTFTSQGASILRVELNSPNYRDLENRTGYPGFLALTDAKPGGCRVQVVGPGSPASKATSADGMSGLRGPIFGSDEQGHTVLEQAGDRITAIDGAAIENRIQFHQALRRTKPGDTITLTVFRSTETGEQRHEFSVELVPAPLAVVANEPDPPTELDQHHPYSYLLTLDRIGDQRTRFLQDELSALPSLHQENWSVQRIDGGLEFRYALSSTALAAIGEEGRLEVIKRFRMPRPDNEAALGDGYAMELDIECANLGSQPMTVGYQLDGPTGMTTEGWWYSYKVHPRRFVAAGARDVMWHAVGESHELVTCSQITKTARKAEEEEENPESPLFAEADPELMQYVGCDTQYFVSVLQPRVDGDPDAAAPVSAVARAVGPLDRKMKKTDVSFRLRSKQIQIPEAASLQHTFTIFTGPKEPEILDQFGLGETIVYGWFGSVSKPMLWLLHRLYWLTGSFSYGIAIILLTLMVRACMFPLGRKMALNAQKMQELAPEMKRIAEKYKNDMEKRGVAQRELFAKHKYNPFSGCLVMFIQMPLFLGLYRGLSCDIALRQAPLIPGLSWCSNLAGPDQFWHWEGVVPAFMSNPYGMFGLGPYLNILPLVTVGLFLAQHKLFTPPPQDEQQQMQHNVMKFMMVFMGILFHKVAAGLCLYLITSTVWGLAERMMLPKPNLAGAAGEEAGGSISLLPKSKSSSTSRNGSNTNGVAAARKKRRKKNKK